MHEPWQFSVFIVGAGDIGRRVGRLEISAGRRVAVLARSEASAAILVAEGFDVVRGDLDEPDTLTPLAKPCSVLYYFAPPPASGHSDTRLTNFLQATTRGLHTPARCVYISTSGVYGDCGGAWVSEDQPLSPQTDRARRRMAAEQTVGTWCSGHGIEHVILRVPGIYGPGRLPIERIRQRIPVVRDEESPFSNRIHADDLAAACVAAARSGLSGQAYNTSDGHPTTMTDYFNQVADLLQLQRPPAISMAEARRVLSPAMLSFLEESKRLNNSRMLADFRMSLRYPDLASGLKASVPDLPFDNPSAGSGGGSS